MKKITISLVLLFLTFALFLPSEALADKTNCRYFHCGDGELNLATNKGSTKFRGRFRNPDGSYDEAAMRQIHRIFVARYGDPISRISPRLIEFIDYIQDGFNPSARVTITSGYRSPTYNTNLRKRGKLAAKASLHQYGMASDFWIAGVPSEKIWYFVRELGFGGVGYYHGKNVHVDVGPSRFWDETSSKVGTDISDNNKLIGIVTDKDIYKPGEEIEMRFIRMTVFPIGVIPELALERQAKGGRWRRTNDFTPNFVKLTDTSCPQFNRVDEMMGIRWRLPNKTKAGRYRIHAKFCNREFEDMPEEVFTPEFEVIER